MSPPDRRTSGATGTDHRRRARRERRPETPPGATGAGGTQRFPFRFSARIAPLSALVGVVPATAHVEITESTLHVRFGPWSLRTPLDNVQDVVITGPYRWWKVAGPPRLSLADGGITFATTTIGGACVSFHEPVPAALPTSRPRHPAATVTVAAPAALAAAIRAARSH